MNLAWEQLLLVFTAFLFIYWLIPSSSIKKHFLAFTSIAVLGFMNSYYVPVLLIVTCINFVLSLNATKKSIFILAILLNSGLLLFHKMIFSLVDENFFNRVSIPVSIGIYSLLMIAYISDIYQKKLNAEKNFIDFILFSLFFPKIIAGPVVRGLAFLPQLKKSPSFLSINLKYYVFLFLIGLFKKVCVYDNLVFLMPAYVKTFQQFDLLSAWTFIIISPIASYCNISGYADMAIAVAGLLGYHLPQNFKFPYFSTNLFVLWSRWHITITNWLRHYIFQPLTKFLNIPMAVSSLITLLVASLLARGLHSAAIVWALFHWIGILICYFAVSRNYFFRFFRFLNIPMSITRLAAIVLTYLFWCFGVTIYNSTYLLQPIDIWKIGFLIDRAGSYSIGFTEWWYFLPLLIGVHLLFYKKPLEDALELFPPQALILIAIAFALFISYSSALQSGAFIYAGF